MYVVLDNFFTALKQKENKYFLNNNTGYYCYYLLMLQKSSLTWFISFGCVAN